MSPKCKKMSGIKICVGTFTTNRQLSPRVKPTLNYQTQLTNYNQQPNTNKMQF